MFKFYLFLFVFVFVVIVFFYFFSWEGKVEFLGNSLKEKSHFENHF